MRRSATFVVACFSLPLAPLLSSSVANGVDKKKNGSHGGLVEKFDDFVSSTSNPTKVGSRLWKTSTVSRTSQLSVKCGWKK